MMRRTSSPIKLWGLLGSLFLGAMALGWSFSAAEESSAPPRRQPHYKHWGYSNSAGTVGPRKWGALPGNETCGIGRQQSPVALVTSGQHGALLRSLPKIAFEYQPSRLRMIDNGHTIQMTYEPGSSLVMAGAEFKLVQFHFHAPSEHTLNGRHLPLEIHLVHTGPDGAPALVVGVLVKSGRANEALEVTFRNLPHREGQTSEPAGAMIDAAALLPQNHAVFGYTGSLTTPPCTEGVQWRVFRESIEMSPKQISAYTSVSGLRRTARPLQPLGDRTVELDLTP